MHGPLALSRYECSTSQPNNPLAAKSELKKVQTEDERSAAAIYTLSVNARRRKLPHLFTFSGQKLTCRSHSCHVCHFLALLALAKMYGAVTLLLVGGKILRFWGRTLILRDLMWIQLSHHSKSQTLYCSDNHSQVYFQHIPITRYSCYNLRNVLKNNLLQMCMFYE